MNVLILRSVLMKTLRDRRKALIWWSAGSVLYLLFLGGFYPSIAEMEEDLSAVISNYPEALMAMFGGGGLDIFSPAGYLQTQAFGWLVPLVFAIFAAGMGARAVAGEEEAGTMDLILATPLPRWRLVVEKFAAMAASLLLLAVGLIVGLSLAGALGLGVPFGRMVAATVGAALLGLFFGSVALAAGAATGRRGVSQGVMAGLAVATYLLDSLGAVVEALDRWRWLSPFFYYGSNRPLVNGLDPVHTMVLLLATAVALAVAIWSFRSRDIAVG